MLSRPIAPPAEFSCQMNVGNGLCRCIFMLNHLFNLSTLLPGGKLRNLRTDTKQNLILQDVFVI